MLPIRLITNPWATRNSSAGPFYTHVRGDVSQKGAKKFDQITPLSKMSPPTLGVLNHMEKKM